MANTAQATAPRSHVTPKVAMSPRRVWSGFVTATATALRKAAAVTNSPGETMVMSIDCVAFLVRRRAEESQRSA